MDIAAQLGHNPTVCLDTCAHVMAEQRGAEPMSAAEQIWRARRTHDSPQLELVAGDLIPPEPRIDSSAMTDVVLSSPDRSGRSLNRNRMVVLEPGLPVQDMQPGGLVSGTDVRAYATREARYRLHQQRFKLDVMRAYRHRCAICTLRERELVQAAHIVPDSEAEGVAAVVNGLALCAIHHLAFDRNLLGIDPEGVVHIAGRLLREIDGPMLRTGLQGFHGRHIAVPRRPADRPDPQRLEVRFRRFTSAAA